ncbi:MAG: ATP-binding protein [Proteobacteria bacterium]|nr:ATP-binding protein [Pseudomonadota bacterium]
MIERILRNRIEKHPKSILLLGPRQVGKSTLCNSLQPDLSVNLADEELFRQHLNDPGLIKRIVRSLPQGSKTILIDEVQRIPSMLNTIQALVDGNSQWRFWLTGSSARKLKRGKANLLPGRVLLEYLPPLLYWELAGHFDLSKALTIGTLPEVYIEEWGPDILHSYAAGYLREEIQAEALTKDLASYSRFLNLAAELSGQYMNYAKVASDAEINKETIRRYMEILSDTLLVEIVPSFKDVDKKRRARQKDKFIFFDLGVRNALLGRTSKFGFSKEEWGHLFEQWMILQVLYYNRMYKKNWRISTYRDAMGVEVDLIIETNTSALAVEIKSGGKAHPKMFKGLNKLEDITGRAFQNYLVYQGEHTQNFESLGSAVPYQVFLDQLLPGLE